MFTAGFIGSPPMNFIPFRGRLLPGDRSVHAGDGAIEIPEVREGTAETDLMLGARPEHVRLSDRSQLRASVVEAEYLGTNQIVTLATAQGTLVKARVPSEVRVRPGETTGLEFRSEKLSLFQRTSGRVLRSALHERVAHG
jgi:multiple sugar transport system ATP-binding protein